MIDNMVDMTRRALTPAMVAEIGTKLGLDPAKAQAVIDTALPAMLGGLAATAASPAGAQAIASAIANQDPAVMDDVLSAGGGEHMLSNLLGAGRIDQIAEAVGNEADVPASAAKAAMGALAPAALGAIGQQDPATWANGAAIMNMFADQKDAIAAAMPAGLGSRIGMGGVASGASTATAGLIRQGLPQGQAAMLRAGTSANAPGGIPSWTWGVVGLVVLAAAYSHFTHKAADAYSYVTPKAAAPPVAAPQAEPDIAALTKQASDTLGGVEATLGTITDAASATAALPKLTAATDSLGKLDGAIGALPPAAKTALAAATAPAIAKINDAADKIEALPGLADSIQPALEALKTRADALKGS